MGFLDSLLGRGKVKGSVALRNAPQNRQILLLTVSFASVGIGEGPPCTLPVPREAKDAWPAVKITDGTFEATLPAGWYHLLVAWTRFVVDPAARKMILDSEEPDEVWATTRPILVDKGETTELPLTPDFYDLLRARGIKPPPPGEALVLPDTPLRR